MKNKKHFLFASLSFILLICTNIIILFNSKFLFKYFSLSNETAKTLAIPFESLMTEYEKIIVYLRNPLITKLNFNYFSLSSNGQKHFFEVKILLTYLFMIAASIGVFLSLYLVYKRFFYQKTVLHKKMQQNLLVCKKYFNRILLATVGFLGLFIIIDFNKVFLLFHNIAFDNDLWIFNETTDSIIKILPENYFMLCAVFILIMLLIESIIINISIKKDVERT
ncbi:TIGR01906 family membrane protein [uncultured Clostridium sp.]|jgi:integral membrane protein (TIGR01906 family)|uniref:TIGR01906 family membrane protein n=1 Tax=uncultured Clostridium sp. TaxID=59620 RepID=UPI002628030C|nr:TIGR01906 family membrane protein [uncultured Clostridium sp.]